ncbi:MAG: VOC family protein, partial [Burkholderiales bacterium]|nr:VOC family protein [Burkholderiales bacterium]
DFADKIIHARLVLPDGGLLYGGDCPPDMPHEGFKGFTLTLNYDSIEEAEKIFQRLAEGGHVIMPMGATFWAESFGMVADKFGCSWNINGKLLPM